MAITRGIPGWAQERAFLWNVLLSECSVLALLRLLLAAYLGIAFFTKCSDGRPFSRMEQSLGTGGVLFPLPPGLVDLIQTACVENGSQGTAIQAEQGYELLARSYRLDLDLQLTPGLVWYNGNGIWMEPFREDLSVITVAADEILTPLGPLFSIAPPRNPET